MKQPVCCHYSVVLTNPREMGFYHSQSTISLGTLLYLAFARAKLAPGLDRTNNYDYYDHNYDDNGTSTNQIDITQREKEQWFVFAFYKLNTFLAGYEHIQLETVAHILSQMNVAALHQHWMTTQCRADNFGRKIRTIDLSFELAPEYIAQKFVLARNRGKYCLNEDRHKGKVKVEGFFFLPFGRLCYTEKGKDLNLSLAGAKQFEFFIKINHLFVKTIFHCKRKIGFVTFLVRGFDYIFCGSAPSFYSYLPDYRVFLYSCNTDGFFNNGSIQLDMNFQVTRSRSHDRYRHCYWMVDRTCQERFLLKGIFSAHPWPGLCRQ